jgi:hypothetical protein
VVRILERLIGHLRRWRRLDAAQAVKRSTPIENVNYDDGAAVVEKINRGFNRVVADARVDGPTPLAAAQLRHLVYGGWRGSLRSGDVYPHVAGCSPKL